MSEKTKRVPRVPINTIDFCRCGAKSKRSGLPCQAPAMRGKQRCRFHGGKSTGPKTVEGKKRSKEAGLKHGFYTQAAIEERKQARTTLRDLRRTLKEMS